MQSMTIEDISVIANEVLSNATGISQPTINRENFVNVADIALKQGYDPLKTAISQVLTKTIFSVRPYDARFKGLFKTQEQYGNHIRKLTPLSTGVQETKNIFINNTTDTPLNDGDTVDQYTILKPKVLQTNFYGQVQYDKQRTIWTTQLDTAFSGLDQFGQFISMVLTEDANELEQLREDLARNTLTNFMGGAILNGQTIDVLTAYNNATGKTLTAANYQAPENFKPFMTWLLAYLNTLSKQLTVRGIRHHVNPFQGGVVKNINRHTPRQYQHLYVLDSFGDQLETMVMSDTYHDQFLKTVNFETVNYWQTLDNPGLLSGTVSHMVAGDSKTDATIGTGNVEIDAPVLGVLFDDEAVGVTPIRESAMTSPFNAKGEFYNQFWHQRYRFWNDNTENGIVLLLK